MLEMLEGMVKTFVNNLVAMNTLEVVLVTLWLSITGYASWYFISAKHHVPLTRKEAEILWKIHKNEAQCKAQKLHPIKRRDKIVGFKCDCGYKYMKKRPMLANTPVDRDDIRSRTSTFDEMHTTYESTTR